MGWGCERSFEVEHATDANAEHGEILINTFDPGNGDGKTRCVLTC